MPVVRVDMNKKSERRGGVPDGEYICEVVQIQQGESSQRKSPQLNVTLEVIEPEEHAGFNIPDYIPLTEDAMFRRSDFFWACGLDVEEGDVEVDTDTLTRLDGDGNAINEQGAIVRVNKRSSKEGDRNRIRIFYDRVEESAPAAPAAPAQQEAPKPPVRKAPVRRSVRAR